MVRLNGTSIRLGAVGALVWLLAAAATPAFAGTITTTTMVGPIGACCLPEGGCVEIPLAECTGVDQGEASTCDFAGCPDPTTTTTTLALDTTTTLPPGTTLPPTTTTTIELPPSTIVVPSTIVDASTTTTLAPTGACCSEGGCFTATEAECGESGYQGDDTSCTEPGICAVCGDGCVDITEECDDANNVGSDGCSATCLEESCYDCTEILPDNDRLVCAGPSTCTPEETAECEVCGDGEAAFDEQCDDGNVANGDCCSSTCQYESNGSACDDDVLCNGADLCDGEGTCSPGQSPPSCVEVADDCNDGFCDPQLDACVAVPVQNGQSCADDSACTAENSGICTDGVCAGAGTILSPSCRWLMLAGAPGQTVQLRAGRGALLDDNACGDTARFGGTTTESLVAVAGTGNGIRFESSATVGGDVATGGSSIDSTLYGNLPGVLNKSLAGGQTLMKTPAGFYNTTGAHPLVDLCDDDQQKMADAVPILDSMPADEDKGPVKLGIGSGQEFSVLGLGIGVIDVQSLRLARKSTLTLKGGPDDRMMVRVKSGRLIFGYGSNVVLTGGLKPENVLFYSKWRICRMAPGVEGVGTVFCPEAIKFQIGTGVKWSGSFLGGTRELRARFRAALTHVPFNGF